MAGTVAGTVAGTAALGSGPASRSGRAGRGSSRTGRPGPSRNISASPMASRQAAAGTSRGGRITSEIAMPSPAASSRPTETTCPARPQRGEQVPGQQALGRGLVVGQAEREQHAVLHQGRGRGRPDQRGRGEHGDEDHDGDGRRAARKRHAARAPSRAANIAAMTGTASQAVDFRSQATPRATPELDRAAAGAGRGAPAGDGVSQRQGQQDQREHRRIGGDHGQVEPDHRRGHRDRRGQQRVAAATRHRRPALRHRDPERRRQRDHRADGQPHPGVAAPGRPGRPRSAGRTGS